MRLKFLDKLGMVKYIRKVGVPKIKGVNVESFKTYYGEARFNVSELIETNKKGLIKLEYYGTKNVIQEDSVEYGIEIVKKEYINKQFTEERNSINNVSENEQDLEKLITLLQRNKVTPISLEDVIGDLARNKIAD